MHNTINLQPIPSFNNDHHSSSTILLSGHIRNAPNGLILDFWSVAYFEADKTGG